MLSKRRSSEAAIQSYLQAESECASEGVTAAAILGTGCFCKRGFGINNWKYRGYYIKEDKKMVYFDPQSNDTRGLVHLSGASITRGPEDNKLKCMKRLSSTLSSSSSSSSSGSSSGSSSSDKRSVSEQALACFSLLLITGHEDTTTGSSGSGSVYVSKNECDRDSVDAGTVASRVSECGSEGKKEKKHRFELVFTTVREAKMFCFAVYCATHSLSVLQFMRFECWSDLLHKIDVMSSEAAGRRRLSSTDYDREEEEEEDSSEQRGRGVRSKRRTQPHASLATSEEQMSNSDSEDDAPHAKKSIERKEGRLREDMVVHSGWFYKKGQLHKAWQLRYFELLSSGLLIYKKTVETQEVRGHLRMLDATLLKFRDMAVKVSSTPLFRRDGAEALLRNRTLHVSGLEIVLNDEEQRTVLITFDMDDAATNMQAEEHFCSALLRLKSEHGRLHDDVRHADGSPISKRRASTTTRLEVLEQSQSHPPTVDPSAEHEVTDFLSQDPDLLAAVRREAEEAAEPWLQRLRVWGQLHKERLICVCAPLWCFAVLVLVRYPSAGMLFLFTTFSVSFGSLFEPYEKPQHYD